MSNLTQKLLAIIQEEGVTPKDLPAIFDENSGVGEEWRIKAAAQVMKADPESAKPFLSRLNPDRLANAVDHSRLEPHMVSLAVRLFPESDRLCDAALAFPLTPESTMMLLASRAEGARLERMVRDELGLLISPNLARALIRNPNLNSSQMDALDRFLRRLREDEQLQIRDEFNPDKLTEDDQNLLIKDEDPDKKTKADTEKTGKHKNIYVRVLKMTAAEKALLAMRGNRTARLLLVRDSNKMVSRAVMRNPRLTENDVFMITQMRDVDDDILRMISENKRWLSKYSVVKNLVFNPRTPVPVALSKLHYLNNNDVKVASRERNMPSPVRQAAVRIAKQRGVR